MIKICWVQHASEWPLFEQIALRLKDQGIDSVFVCITPEAHEEYLKDGFESHFMSDIFSAQDILSRKEISEIDLKYGPPGIREIGNSDVRIRNLFGKDRNKRDELIARAYKYWESFFDTNKIDYVIVREKATFATRTAYNVSRFSGIAVVETAVGPSNDRFVLNDVGETYAWSELIDSLDSKVQKLTQEQKDFVDAFVTRRIEKQNKQRVRFSSNSLYSFLRSFIGMILRDTSENLQRYPVKMGSFRHARKKILKRIIWKYFTNNFFTYDELKEEKFVYFPFFSRDEAGYLVNTHFFTENELSLVEEVAESLPAGHLLYFKGHPTSGELAYSELRRLRRNPNIRILHPSTSSQELIENSDAVVVVHGTTGWETLLSRKPVVCLGAAYYSYSSLVYKVRDLSELTSTLWEAIRNGSDIYKDNEDEWYWFVFNVVNTSGDGVYVRVDPPYGFPSDVENTKKIAQFIAKKVKRDLTKV